MQAKGEINISPNYNKDSYADIGVGSLGIGSYADLLVQIRTMYII